MFQWVNTTLYSVTIRIHVSAKTVEPSPGLITRIQKGVYFAAVFQVQHLNIYKLKCIVLYCKKYRMSEILNLKFAKR